MAMAASRRFVGQLLPATGRAATLQARSVACTAASRRADSAGSSPPLHARTLVSEISGGCTVATEPHPGHWGAINVLLEVGSRFETEESKGAAYFLDRLAYKSTSGRSHGDMMSQLEALGGAFMCSSSRDAIMYHAIIFNKDIDAAMELLSEVVLEPELSQEEIDQQKGLLGYELDDMTAKPDFYLMELLHQAAYENDTVGRPQVCSEEDASRMTAAKLHTFRDQFTTPSGLVISGAGIPHDEFVGSAEKHFGSKMGEHAGKPEHPAKKIQAKYVGGSMLDNMPESPADNALGIPLSQIALGFQSVGWNDDDLYPLAVLQLLLGGGLSFSIGGPGKGMFARMYTNVLNPYPWVQSAMCMNLSYGDTGLFYLQGSAPPDRIQDLLSVFVREMVSVSNFISPDEVSRAKNQLKSSLLMNLESKPIVAEDIGRQLLGLGYRIEPEALLEHIENVQNEDIRRVASQLLQSPPSLAGFGDLSRLQNYDDLQNTIAKFR